MKFGVKTYDSEEFLDFFVDKCDFFEVQAIRGKDYSFLKKYSKKIVLHCEHSGFGFNLADPSKREENIEAVNFAKDLADKIGVKTIVIHPGDLANENCSRENSLAFLKEFCDERFCIENMPGLSSFNNCPQLCFSPKEIKRFMDETGLGFCFDINHAVEYAVENEFDYWEFLHQFEDLNPRHYHLGGQKINEKITHLSFSESDLNLNKVFEIIQDTAEITLEVRIDKENVFDDLKAVGRIQ